MPDPGGHHEGLAGQEGRDADRLAVVQAHFEPAFEQHQDLVALGMHLPVRPVDGQRMDAHQIGHVGRCAAEPLAEVRALEPVGAAVAAQRQEDLAKVERVHWAPSRLGKRTVQPSGGGPPASGTCWPKLQMWPSRSAAA